MADTKISDLTAAGALAGTEPLPIVQGGVTVRTTPGAIAGLVDLSSKQDAFTLGTGLSFAGTVLTLSTNLQGWSGLATSAKQDTLVSGTNIRTVNGNTLLGSTDLVISGSLANFTESVNTSAPNATVPVCSLTAANAATDVDWVFAVKGNGARLAQVPDNTTNGGNKRGTGAFDFQTSRTANTQVALGQRSTICNGQNNTTTSNGTNGFIGGGSGGTVSNANAAVVGGNTGTASGSRSFVGCGQSTTASGTDSAAIAGNGVTASGTRAFAGAGTSNDASGNNSWIPGGSQAITRGLEAAWAWSGARRSSQGDNQVIGITAQGSTTNNTPLVLTADRAAASATNILVMPNNSCWAGTVEVTGRQGANVVYTRISLVMSRGANAASTVVDVQNPDYTFTAAALAGVAITILADTTRGAPVVQVTGLTATTIDWFAIFHGAQIVR